MYKIMKIGTKIPMEIMNSILRYLMIRNLISKEKYKDNRILKKESTLIKMNKEIFTKTYSPSKDNFDVTLLINL